VKMKGRTTKKEGRDYELYRTRGEKMEEMGRGYRVKKKEKKRKKRRGGFLQGAQTGGEKVRARFRKKFSRKLGPKQRENTLGKTKPGGNCNLG